MKDRTTSIFLVILVFALVGNVTNTAQANNNGPQIILRYPELMRTASEQMIRTTTFAHFEMVFEPREAPVNMYSLTVLARKGIFKKSLTNLLKPYIRGNAIIVDGIKLPQGKFVLEVQIADRDGEQTSQQFHVFVQ
jgi:hypothetical protein